MARKVKDSVKKNIHGRRGSMPTPKPSKDIQGGGGPRIPPSPSGDIHGGKG